MKNKGKVFIIAEAGVNHNGDRKIAKKLIDAAVAAGADAVKFQSFTAEKLVTQKASKAEYQVKNTGAEETQLAMLKKLEFSAADFKELFIYCQKNKIIFMSTPFDEANVGTLDKFGMTIFKVPSGEITNKSLLQTVARTKKPILLSTGMSYLGEIEKAINWIREAAGSKLDLTLLHCTSCYPVEPEDVNLRAMFTMREVFGVPVGYSDHTQGIDVSLAAVALGAAVIEKHFTLDKKMPGPDHKASLEPQELKQLVRSIRRIEQAMGNGQKIPRPSEINIRQNIRRSLVSSRPIKAGEIVSANDFIFKRPGTGIPPEEQALVNGLRVKRSIAVDTVVTWKDFKDA